MYFPDDFKEELKDIVPEEYHKNVNDGDFSTIAGQLQNIENSVISAETIVKAFEEGFAQEKVIGAARKILKARELSKKLGELWTDQFGKK